MQYRRCEKADGGLYEISMSDDALLRTLCTECTAAGRKLSKRGNKQGNRVHYTIGGERTPDAARARTARPVLARCATGDRGDVEGSQGGPATAARRPWEQGARAARLKCAGQVRPREREGSGGILREHPATSSGPRGTRRGTTSTPRGSLSRLGDPSPRRTSRTNTVRCCGRPVSSSGGREGTSVSSSAPSRPSSTYEWPTR